MYPPKLFYPSQFDFIENVEGYKSGGFHPVAIGDVFAGGRYRVVHKLGYGGSSTNWLARSQSGKLVALKVLRADAVVSPEHIDELPELVVPLKVSEYIQTKSPVACSKIQVPEDYFMEKGPNGSHLCLVYQLAGPSVLLMSGAMTSGRLRKDLAKKVAKQLVCAVELLHTNGFVHGDLTPSNILFRVAEHVQNWSDSEVYLNLGNPKTDRVRTSDGSPPRPHAPSHLIEPIDFAPWKSSFLQEDTLLIDFGQSFSNLRPPTGYNPATVPHYLSPEARFERKCGFPADIWSLGCTIFEIRAGLPLFDPFLGGYSRILKAIVETLGKMPEPWWGAFEARDLWFDEYGEPKDGTQANKTPIKEQLASTGYYDDPSPTRDGDPMVEPSGTGLDKVEIELLGDLLEKMMRYQPEDRIKISEVVAHPWFALE